MTVMVDGCKTLILLEMIFVLVAVQSVGAEAMAAVVCQAGNPDGADRQVIENKLKLLESIVTDSSTATRIGHSGNRNAMDLLNQAREHGARAGEMLHNNCLADAEQQLNEGLRTVEQASKLVLDRKHNLNIARQEYENKLERIISFREAYLRIVAEKTPDKSITYLDEGKLDTVLRSTAVMAQNNDYEQANKTINKAVYMIEAALTLLRDKETLVHELNFASVEEEYAYEMETNKGYMKLLDLVMVNSDPSDPAHSSLAALIKRNEELKKSAVAKAAAGDIEAALKDLEEGTQYLVRAMRFAGIGL